MGHLQQLILFLLIILSTFGFSFPCKDAERATLLQFKHNFNDTCGWNLAQQWVAGSDCCKWDEVACDNVTGNIIKLDITEGYCFEAVQVNPSPLHLPYLQYLDLSFTSFNWATIPDFFGSMSQLQYLDLSRNYALQKDILSQLANLTTLVHLDLAHSCATCQVGRNNMDGVLKLVNLKYLDMTGINLSGAIHTLHDTLHKFPSLSKLVLSGCQLGNYHLPIIPTSNVSYTVIEHLDLGENLFTGPFPQFIQNLTSIKALDLSHNNLTSLVPIWLGKKINLQQLNLGGNRFNGFFPHVVQNLSFLTSLDLSTNHFRSSIPSWLATKKYLSNLDLSGNHFDSVDGGVMNFMSRLCGLQLLDLSNNQVEEELSESFNNFSRCRIYYLELPATGTLDSFLGKFIDFGYIGTLRQYKAGKAMPFLRSLILANNYISGSIPSAMCHFPSLQLLGLQKNRLAGVIPDCWENSEIYIIDLASNALSGLIPNSLSKVDTLQVMSLYNNSLGGEFPRTFSASRLILLDVGKNNLDGEIPVWIGTNTSSLKILVLRENKFKGTIPLQLCSIDDLQILDLASNNFTGTIPLCFGHFKGMIGSTSQTLPSFILKFEFPGYPNECSSVEVIKGKGREYTKTLYLLVNMDLSCNNLVGMIPATITNLSLIGLNLSHNHLTGSIPKKIGMMTALESLDLSSNRLSGQIPESISSLDSLSNLNLAFNNLQGRIPTSTHFQTLDDPAIYEGNPGLCGDPLPKKCFGDPSLMPVVEDDDEEDGKHGRILLYIVITTGFATGFWGVIGSLVFLRKLRHDYFRLAEEIADWIYVRVAINVHRINRGR